MGTRMGKIIVFKDQNRYWQCARRPGPHGIEPRIRKVTNAGHVLASLACEPVMPNPEHMTMLLLR